MSMSWIIDRMEVYPEFTTPNGETLSNCVSKIYWTCYGIDSDSNGNPIFANQTGFCNIPHDPLEPYVDYLNLTQDEVLNWVWLFGSDRNNIESVVQDKLNSLKAVAIAMPLPWS
jgi:hypothetical protein